MYEIYRRNDDGNWVNIDTGSVKDAEIGRAKAGTSPPKVKAARVAKKGGDLAGGKRAGARDDIGDPLFITDKVPGAPRFKRRGAPLSPLRQRIAEAKAIALQALADKKQREGR